MPSNRAEIVIYRIIMAGILVFVIAIVVLQRGTDKGFDLKIHNYLVSHPEILAEMEVRAAKAPTSAADPDVAPLIRAHSREIFGDDRDASIGPRNAKRVLVLFADFQCGHCKAEAAPALISLIAEHPDVRFVFKEYPIFGPISQSAARSALAAARQGKYLPVFQALMAAPLSSDVQIDDILRRNNVNVPAAHAVASDPAVQAQIEDVSRLARTLGVEGTPTFVLGEHMISGTDIPQIERLLAQPTA